MVVALARTRREAAEGHCSTILVDSPKSANAGTAGRLRGFHVAVRQSGRQNGRCVNHWQPDVGSKKMMLVASARPA